MAEADDNAEFSEDHPMNDYVENEEEKVLKAIEDVKQEYNAIQSQLFLSKAVHRGASSLSHTKSSDNSNDLSELEDGIDRLCMQEAAQQCVLETDTLQKILSSGALSSELEELLDAHLKSEIEMMSLSSQIQDEFLKLQESQRMLSDTVQKCVLYKQKLSEQCKVNSTQENKATMQKLRKQLKEIRFMQLIIPRMVSELKIDLQETEWARKLCQEVRNPILSLDDLL